MYICQSLQNLLNFRLSLSSWGPIKVGTRGNLPPPPAPLLAALLRVEEGEVDISSTKQSNRR
jgi:hypothetical protein